MRRRLFLKTAFLSGAVVLAAPDMAPAQNNGRELDTLWTVCRSDDTTVQRIRTPQDKGWKISLDDNRINEAGRAILVLRTTDPADTDQKTRETLEFIEDLIISTGGWENLGEDGEMLARGAFAVTVDNSTAGAPVCLVASNSDSLKTDLADVGFRFTRDNLWKWHAELNTGGTRMSAFGATERELPRLGKYEAAPAYRTAMTFVTKD